MHARSLAVLALLVPAVSLAFASTAHAQDLNSPAANGEDATPPRTPAPTAPQQQQPAQVQQSPQEAGPQYTAPMYQRTQPSYVPQSIAMSGPHELRDWNEGDPIPAGYHPIERTRKGMIIGGAVTFGSLYFISLLVAAGGADSSYSGESNPEAAMWVPVAGPFIQMARTDSATANVFLAVDGLAQLAGVGMFIYGVASPAKVLVRNDLAGKNALKLSISPIVSKGMSGAGLVGTF